MTMFCDDSFMMCNALDGDKVRSDYASIQILFEEEGGVSSTLHFTEE